MNTVYGVSSVTGGAYTINTGAYSMTSAATSITTASLSIVGGTNITMTAAIINLN